MNTRRGLSVNSPMVLFHKIHKTSHFTLLSLPIPEISLSQCSPLRLTVTYYITIQATGILHLTEHLCTSCDKAVSLVEIPYICKEGYTVGDFESCSSLQGYKPANNGLLIVQGDGWAKLHILLQEWLYFGLLENCWVTPSTGKFSSDCSLLWTPVHSYNDLTADAA